ncbi:MAG: YfcE family phosphodiesterase [Clostridia bacterium]|nr:YfcE family phosphodiesterase [Clostridia bacterium]
MKILVISDIHGSVSYTERIIEREKPDEVIFLGDGYRDIKESAQFYPDIRFHLVGGNCDYYCDEQERLISLGGKSIFFTHGHRYNVKLERQLNYITLRAHAANLGADIVLFGHTHVPDTVYMNAMIMMNPGAVMAGQYGIIEIVGDEVKTELKRL